jgi:endo-1,4-beta-xylanase
VPAELHLFANAGHGFGYRNNVKPSAAARWPERLVEWLADSGMLATQEPKQP